MSVNAPSDGPGEWLRELNPCARRLHVHGLSSVSKIAISPFPSLPQLLALFCFYIHT